MAGSVLALGAINRELVRRFPFGFQLWDIWMRLTNVCGCRARGMSSDA